MKTATGSTRTCGVPLRAAMRVRSETVVKPAADPGYDHVGLETGKLRSQVGPIVIRVG